MRALTLWPENAWAICVLGKDVENRTWTAPLDMRSRRFAIHAGAYIGGRPGRVAFDEAIFAVGMVARASGWKLYRTRPNPLVWQAVPELPAKPVTRYVHTRSVVAVATLDRCILDSTSPWAQPSSAHWCLRDVVVLERPVRCRGAQGLWHLPTQVEEAVLEQVGRAA